MHPRSVWLILIFAINAIPAHAQSNRERTAPPAKLITIQEKQIRFSAAIRKLLDQAGMDASVLHLEVKEDPLLKLDLTQATFWRALDRIAGEANCQLSLYRTDGKIGIVPGISKNLQVNHSGLFRLSFRRIVAVRDFETGAHYYHATLELAWDPRFRPLLFETHPREMTLTCTGSSTRDFPVNLESSLLAAPEKPLTALIDVRLPALPREMIHTVERINLKGRFSAIIPSGMLDFTFDSLTKMQTEASGSAKTQAGVTVKISKLVLDPERWTVQVTLAYPPGGPKFESFQSWIAQNEIFLVNQEGARLMNSSSITETETATKAVISYHFVDDPSKKPRRGKNPGDWHVVYRTPASIVEVPIPFEFKDVLLP